jgi:hypothetical protein
MVLIPKQQSRQNTNKVRNGHGKKLLPLFWAVSTEEIKIAVKLGACKSNQTNISITALE